VLGCGEVWSVLGVLWSGCEAGVDRTDIDTGIPAYRSVVFTPSSAHLSISYRPDMSYKFILR
jgi:hypothetical protein